MECVSAFQGPLTLCSHNGLREGGLVSPAHAAFSSKSEFRSQQSTIPTNVVDQTRVAMMFGMVPLIERKRHGLDQHPGFKKHVIGDIRQRKLGIDQAVRHFRKNDRDIHVAFLPVLASGMTAKQNG